MISNKPRIALLSLVLAGTLMLVGLTLIPAPAAAGHCWTEARWVNAGCCGAHKKIKQQERDCCEGSGCGGWSDTGNTQCAGVC